MKLELAGEMATDLAEDDNQADVSFNPVDDHLRAKLRAAGLTPDRQNLALCRLLFLSGDRHVTADMLWRDATAIGLPLTLDDVANLLRQFAGRRLVREVALYGPTIWYDTKIGPHFHFYDEDTEQLYDIPEQMVPQFELPFSEGVKIVGVDLIVRMRRKAES